MAALLLSCNFVQAGVDMQAHVASDEGKQAYTDYQNRQTIYYTGIYAPDALFALQGNELFGVLNTLMGNTCRLEQGGYSYNTLRSAYVGVDRDLNNSGYIIGYYDGSSMEGTWDSGKTWNREHTWPQSKGANKGISMGHDMQSVRPTSTKVNSSRGNAAYGENGTYYDPNDVEINNIDYKSVNMGSYRGDAARVILYDYIVYGAAGGRQNSLYNGNAQLLSKLGTSGVFQSLEVLLKWHMQDPPSVTEMVRNDGAEDYQGNRNPFIDYPELAIQMFYGNSDVTTYNVDYQTTMDVSPKYKYATKGGFVTYLTLSDGTHPAAVKVAGATAKYDAQLGRLVVSNVTGNITISATSTADNQMVASEQAIRIYSFTGVSVGQCLPNRINATLAALHPGIYILCQGKDSWKVVR